MQAVIGGRYASLLTRSVPSSTGRSLQFEESRAVGAVRLLRKRSLVIVFVPPPPPHHHPQLLQGWNWRPAGPTIFLHSLHGVGEKEFPAAIQLSSTPALAWEMYTNKLEDWGLLFGCGLFVCLPAILLSCLAS